MKGGAIVLQDRRSKLAENRVMMSSVAPHQHEAPTVLRTGADLRAARERLGWELADIAAGLHIRQSYLEALEEGRLDLLPGNAYALGFLRIYATSVGLDADELARRFKAEAGEVNARTELAFPAPVPQRGLPTGAVVLLGLLLAVGAYAGWYHLSGEGRLPAETTAIPQRLAPLAQQVPPPVTVPDPSAKVAKAKPKPAPAPTAAEAAEPPPPVEAVSPVSAAAAPAVHPEVNAQQAASDAPGAQADTPVAGTPEQTALAESAHPLPPPPAPLAPLPDSQAATVAAKPQPHVVLRATADAWVQVRDKSGQVLLNRIMHAGDTWPVPDRPNLLLTTGNAGGTELVVDGVSTGILGNSGAVKRDLPLDAASIRQSWLGGGSANGVQAARLGAAGR